MNTTDSMVTDSSPFTEMYNWNALFSVVDRIYLVIELEGNKKPLGIHVLPDYYEEKQWDFFYRSADYTLLTVVIPVWLQ